MINEALPGPSTTKGRLMRVPCSRGCGGFAVTMSRQPCICSKCRRKADHDQRLRERARVDAMRAMGPEMDVRQLRAGG